MFHNPTIGSTGPTGPQGTPGGPTGPTGYTGPTGPSISGYSGTFEATFFQTVTAPTPNSSGTVIIRAKDTASDTLNAGWLPLKRSDGTTVYVPYWL